MSINESLPGDVAALQVMIEEQAAINECLARDNEKLKFELEQLRRYIYGQRSERHVDDSSQLTLFDQTPELDLPADEEVVEEEITYRRRKRSKSDRFPENLPRQTRTIDVSEAQRICPCCGDEMPVIDTDIRERLEFVPAKFLVHRLEYLKRACGKCKETVSVAPPPESNDEAASLTKGSQYGFGVTAQIILGKYADHLPLYRLEDVFARAGVVIPRSTQVGLLDAAADLLAPLCSLMIARLMESNVIGMDDTPVRLQDLSLPGKMRTARMWLARGRETSPYNAFFFHDSRERAGPANFLKDFEGFVTVDAYGVDDGVYLGSDGRIKASCCHAHVRRKFEAAKSNDPTRAAWVLTLYRQLFDIEDRVSGLSDDDRLSIRVSESLPLLERLKSWLDVQKADAKVLPKSAIGKAVRYALNQWKPLLAYTRLGSLPIHNNDTERDLRRLTIGRKNWMFFGSSAGGEVAARMYTITGSAHRHNLDLWAYLDDVLRTLASGAADLDTLLPDAWAKSHPESIRKRSAGG